MRLQANTSKIPNFTSVYQTLNFKISIKITVANLLNYKKTKLHIYSKTTIVLSSRQCICNLHRSANEEDPKLK